jgi:hypothetical protein
MATLLQLQTRIRLELQRDDIAVAGEAVQGLTDAVDRAIDYWADRKFWFNQTSATANTVNATATVAIPAALRTVDRVAYLGQLLPKVALSDIQYRTDSGIPSQWAESDGTITLWPIPNAVYALTLYGLAELGTPASGSSNAWTTDGLDLIDATARKILYRDYFANDQGVVRAMAAEQEAERKLLRETRRKAATPARTDIPRTRTSFNINRGY